jgi:PST family polysaccharide transporter
MGISAKLKIGVLWGAGGRFVSNALGLVGTLVLAHLLVPDDFGVAAIGTTLLGALHSFTQFTLSEALIHHEDPHDGHLDTAWTMGVIRSTFLALILLIATPFVENFYNDERLVPVMLIISTAALFSGFYNPRLAMLNRELKFSQDLVFLASQRIAMLVVSVTLAIVFRNYLAIVGGILALSVVGVAVSYILAPYKPKFRLKEARELFGYSGWLTLSEVVSALSWRLDPLIVGKFAGQTGLGIFSVSSNLASLPTNEITGVMKTTLFPGFRQVRHDPERLRRAYMRIQALTSAIVIPCAFGLAAVADPLIRLVLGEKWLPAIPVIQVLSVVYALKTIGSTAEPLAMAVGETRLLFKRNFQLLVVRTPIIIAGLYLQGLDGLLVALVVTTFFGIAFDVMMVRQICRLSLFRQLLENTRTLISAFVMMGLTIAIVRLLPLGNETADNTIKVVVSVTFGIVVYLATMLIAWKVAGQPEGPEREILSIVHSTNSRLSQRFYGPRG